MYAYVAMKIADLGRRKARDLGYKRIDSMVLLSPTGGGVVGLSPTGDLPRRSGSELLDV